MAVDQTLAKVTRYNVDGIVRPQEFFYLEYRAKKVRIVEPAEPELVHEAVEELITQKGNF